MPRSDNSTGRGPAPHVGAAISVPLQVAQAKSPLRRRYGVDAFLGRSRQAGDVRTMIARLAQLPLSSIVITGETGTGKGLAARILHDEGRRAEMPLIEVNCAALSRELMESELFGHEAGAFTSARSSHRGLMEQAHTGTLFLDEIGELDRDLQAKFLKAIEDKEIRRVGGERTIAVDVQIIAASSRDLQGLASANAFRADLYHRISIFELELPPLRARKEDIADIVASLIVEFNAAAGKGVTQVPSPAQAALEAYDWPGNIRELRNVLERSVLLSSGEELCLEGLPAEGSGAPPFAEQADVLSLTLDGSLSLDDIERLIIKTVLRREQYNVSAAARRLGLTREKLRYRLDRNKRQGEILSRSESHDAEIWKPQER